MHYTQCTVFLGCALLGSCFVSLLWLAQQKLNLVSYTSREILPDPTQTTNKIHQCPSIDSIVSSSVSS